MSTNTTQRAALPARAHTHAAELFADRLRP